MRVTLLLWTCLGIGLAVLSLPARAAKIDHPVPKATCGPSERTESVQGETTLAERFASGPARAYNCNLEFVGQFEGEGSSYAMQVFDHCAYYSTAPSPKLRHPGTVAVDLSDPRHPQAAAYLNTPAMLDSAESLEIAPGSKLLLANKFMLGTPFDIYDLSGDCRHPVLKGTFSVPRMMSHSGVFTADGRTFYGASWGIQYIPDRPREQNDPPAAAIFAFDASNPSQLRGLATWLSPKPDWVTHSVSVNAEGTRAYVTFTREADDREKADKPNGLVILDVSDIQQRRPNPQIRLISTLYWDDTHFAEFAVPVRIQHRSYVIWTDLVGALGLKNPPPSDVCDSGRPGHGFARIIDISDEKNPQVASKLMLEVHAPKNCLKVMHDPVVGFGYGSLACDVDDADDAKLVACGYLEGGLRVFDIRDPRHPKEVAYYKPPVRQVENRPGALLFDALKKGHTADQAEIPRFLKNGQGIAFTSADNGLQVVRFTDHFRTSHKDLFRN